MTHRHFTRSLVVSTVLMLLVVAPVFAQDTGSGSSTASGSSTHTSVTPTNPEQSTTSHMGDDIMHSVNSMQQMASHEASQKTANISSIIARSDSMITTRVTSLQTVLTRIQSDARLSSSEKTSLTSDVQTEITNLQTLKAKIDGDTDLTTAMADSKQIITNYYVYMVFQPKMQLLITLNSLQTMATNLQAIVPQLQTLVTTYGQGKDTTQLQKDITDISSQLTTLQSSIATDITTVEALSTSSPQSAHTTVMQVRSSISTTVKTALQTVRHDLDDMRPLLRQLINPTNQSRPPGSVSGESGVGSSSAGQLPTTGGLRPINAVPQIPTSTSSSEVNNK